MKYGLIMIVGIIGVAFVLTAFVRMIRGPGGHPVQRKPFMTDHEKAFHAKLSRAVEAAGSYRVHAQVAMGALIRTKPGLDQSADRSMRNRFDRKIVDFVIVDSDMEVVALVELDDRTHNAERDAARDAITSAAGYTTIRMRNGYRTPLHEIAGAVAPALSGRR